MTFTGFTHSTLSKRGVLLIALSSMLITAGCEEGASFDVFKKKDAETTVTPQRSTKIVERDVEAPDVFSVSEAGLWDGRPSLGGVWVAHPDVKDPERVIIRNVTNNKFVIGALFRRERQIPGPRLQISSDAAGALGMLAGQPIELNVTALRREEVPQESPTTNENTAPSGNVTEAAHIKEENLSPVAAAAAAIATAEAKADTSKAAPVKPAAQKSSALEKPYIQIGIFSVKTNANNAAGQMRNAGMVPIIKKQTSKSKTFWRVLVGPATSKSERSSLVKKIHGTGFTDAYAVTN